MKKINLLGYSGHSYVVTDTIKANNDIINGYFGLEKDKNPFGIPYLGNEKMISEFSNTEDLYYFPSVGDNQIRKSMIHFIEENKLEQTTIIHPTASISAQCIIEKSVFIGSNAIINILSHIGKGVIVNTGAIVEHECIIGNYCHIAPSTVLTGNVSVGENSFIGANSVVIPNIKIGSNVIVGAGSVVVSDIPDNETWVGNPARKIK